MTASRRLAVGTSLALAVLLAACSPNAREQDVEFRVPVSVGEVGTGLVEDRIVATGTLRPPEMIQLVAGTNGILSYARNAGGRRLAEGDRVEAGQLIAEIIGDDVRIEARTEATEGRYNAALRDFESSESLFSDGLITEQELRRAEAELADARVALEASRLRESRARLVTPISGVVQSLGRQFANAPAADGQLVGASFVVAEIAPIETLIADVALVGPDFSRVRVGQQARVRHYAWEDRRFPGTVTRLAPSIDPMTRTFTAEVAIANSKRDLRPGMFVEVTLIAERREEVPVVPRTAVAERGGVKVVFVLQGQKVTRREVVVGLGDDDVVEIRDGLDVGERIVVKGLETLSDGTRVRVSGA
jgi:RND family efflux transporter MFP subunit